MGDILAYDVPGTPGLVINEEVVNSGRLPSRAEVMTWSAGSGRGIERDQLLFQWIDRECYPAFGEEDRGRITHLGIWFRVSWKLLELYETDPSVPTLGTYTGWGTGEWHLHDDGDEFLLLHSSNRPVGVVVCGNGNYPGVAPHPGISLYTHSLEHFPYQLDTDDCSVDLRDWPFPNPGELP